MLGKDGNQRPSFVDAIDIVTPRAQEVFLTPPHHSSAY